jgi:hypothetical protein
MSTLADHNKGTIMPASVSLDGLQPWFRARVELFLADPEARAAGVWVQSAVRSRQEQERLYAAYLAGGALAARPGTSNHERGLAADLATPGGQTGRLHPLGRRYGLVFPIRSEPWHAEPDPNWQPVEEDVMVFTDVQVDVDQTTGHGWAAVPGVGLDRCPVPVYLSGPDGVVAKVGLSRDQAPAGAVVTVDMGGPIFAPITVTVRVAHNR